MALLDKESLFSLELVAESLSLSKDISCRFPALAFRLLDFPTLMIYHVEPDVGPSIKRKLNADPHYKVPLQLKELQNKDGHYIIRKGKSCLFKVAANILLAHLQNTPMYVMIVDAYPSTPKLIGNCTVPLDKTMNMLYGDIRTLGLSVPCSKGEKGSFKIFNLMGDEIGEISFGFRLLSLGIGLISHIPDKSVAKMKSKKSPVIAERIEPVAVQSCLQTMHKEVTESILSDIKTADQNVQVVFSSQSPVTETSMMETQTYLGPQKVVSTQTDEIVKKKIKKDRSKSAKYDSLNTMAQEIVVDDIFISNTFCPPSLFYNSKADPPQIAQGLTFDDYMAQKKRELNGQNDSDSSYDSDGTIRQEDRFSESEFDAKPVVKTVDEINQVEKKKVSQKKASKPEFNVNAMANFPLLSALMSEIVALQGASGINNQQVHQIKRELSPKREKAFTPRTPRTPSYSRPPSGRQAKPVEKGKPSIDNYKSQIKQVVKTKGWLTKATKKDAVQKPASSSAVLMAEKKTKIMPGMTNTQRLRLAKTNPQLLQKLEKEEEKRVSSLKAKRQDLGETYATPQHDISTVVSKYPSDVSQQYDGYARYQPLKHSQESPKRPVPTPRSSMKEDHITVREVPNILPRQKSKENDNMYLEDTNGSLSTRSHIDVHMPQIPAAIDESMSDYEGHQPIVHKQPSGTFKTYDPGFPKDISIQSNGDYSAQYSENFEDTNEVHDIRVSEVADIATEQALDIEETLGLKRMDDVYSDDNDFPDGKVVTEEAPGLRHTINTYHSGYENTCDEKTGIDAGEFLGLRQVVDTYSDDDNKSHTESKSSFSLKSEHVSEENEVKQKLRIATSLVRTVAPATSEQSPLESKKQPTMPLRNPVTASSSTFEDHSPDSTAYINRSDVTSQFSSLESMGQAGMKLNQRTVSPRKPFISPRKSLERIRTESVSSYAPSDPDIEEYGSQVMPLTPTQEYSDSFETAESEEDSSHVKQMKDARVAPEARFGYTWSGQS